MMSPLFHIRSLKHCTCRYKYPSETGSISLFPLFAPSCNVFGGSRTAFRPSYSQGVLDILANRCYARGTNAWTDTDHTAYELTTAGHEGFLQVLPIYVEHILWPTITAEAFHTEVHYVSGEGEDGGVVYCEMQGRENSAEGRCEESWIELGCR